ncbi:MAG TPA: ABC transporter substrate-binding protein [Planctomycetota bacterium]|nr:ABC transporter substrate-binding protein [Planctomycetota bacterium]
MKIQSLALFAILPIAALSLSGCGKEPAAVKVGENGLSKIKVGYIGLTCEAPLFMAQEKGFFKEEGLEAEMVKCEWSKYKDVLALGGFDITHHLIMMFLKPLEQGLNVRFTGGVHTGCLRVQTSTESTLKTAQDLKGKRIGVPGQMTPPMIFATRWLNDNGVDAGKDIEWKVYPAGELGLALEKGEVDAIADAEPIGTMLVAGGKVRNLADQAKDAPYKDEYCCAVIANGKWADSNPDLCARATRAILKGAKWVQTNPAAAAREAVEKKYLGSNPELNTSAIANLNYMPSIDGCHKAMGTAATAMQKAGMLDAGTNIDELVGKGWLPMPGITDQWLGELKVEKVAMGQIPPDQEQRLLAELAVTSDNLVVATCCSKASKVVQAKPPETKIAQANEGATEIVLPR